MKVVVLANKELWIKKLRMELIESINVNNEVYVVCELNENSEHQNSVNWINVNMNTRGTNIIKEINNIYQYYLILSKIKPDVVLTFSTKPNIYGGIVSYFLKYKYILTVTGLGTLFENDSIFSKILRLFYMFSINKSVHVLFQNKANFKKINDKLSIEKKSSFVPGSGVNMKIHYLEKYPKGNNVDFIYVGRIMKEKGVSELLEAFSIIKNRHKNTTLTLVGQIEEEKYRLLIDELVNNKIIHYVGQVEDVHSIVKQKHALINPSFHEGMSNVILEAASCGRPVLASNIPGCKEAVNDSITGFLFEPKNVDSLVDAMDKFINLPYEDKVKMGLNGRLKIEKEFDRNIVVKKYIEVIEKIKEESL